VMEWVALIIALVALIVALATPFYIIGRRG
jgi:hypothetical protein